jgi:hypothetical protein
MARLAPTSQFSPIPTLFTIEPLITMTQAQLTLPFAPPARVRHGRSVAARPEDDMVHGAVLALRRLGHQVYRAGADHKVDGRLLSTRQLAALAGSAARHTVRAASAAKSDPSTK